MHSEKIVKITELSPERTMDIEVDSKDHLFYGNGIATSNSHSVLYAHIGYYTAYYKANYPLEFFCTYLKNSKHRLDPIKEKKELVEDCKRFGIKVMPPSIITMEKDFHIYDGCVRFGLSDIKGVGEAAMDKIKETINYVSSQLYKTIDKMTWFEFLLFVTPNINKTAIESVIKCGALHFPISRTAALYELSKWNSLTEKEQTRVRDNYKEYSSLVEALENTKGSNVNRTKIINDIVLSLKSPPYSLEDTDLSIAKDEEKLLGVAVSGSVLKSKDISLANMTCEEYNNGKDNFPIAIACQISRVSEYVVKDGQNAGKKILFVGFFDETGMIDSASAFDDKITEYGDLLVKNNSVIIVGNRNKLRNGEVRFNIIQVIQI